MAITIKSGANRAMMRAATNNTFPLRSTTITIGQDGLVKEIASSATDAKPTVINLGHRGDDKATRIQVLLEGKTAAQYSINYSAALVFYHDKEKTKTTLDMSSDGQYFFLDVPQSITKTAGNYLIYFILREKLSEDGAVGPDSDPAYREVFVSEAKSGVVEEKSGYQFVTDFDWDAGVYNYNIGSVISSTWEETDSSDVYTTQIYLGGLNVELGQAVGIKVNEEVKVEGDVFVDITLPAGVILDGTPSTLSSTVYFAVSTDDTELLEKITINYPVRFEANVEKALKMPITLKYTPYLIKAEGNLKLGMKMDSYVTPIDVREMVDVVIGNLKEVVKKYTIFAKDNLVYVCESIDGYCWIPFGVTSRPGDWYVTFVGRSENYTYYTGLLKLPVEDNMLSKQDIESDSIYQAVLDVENKKIIDLNNYVIYAQAEEGSVRISYTGSDLERTIGWVLGIADKYGQDTIIETLDGVIDANGRINKLETDFNTLSVDVDNRINEINEEIRNLDSTELEKRVEEAEGGIKTLDSAVKILSETEKSHGNSINNINKSISDLTSKTTTLESSTSSLELRVGTAEVNIDSLEKQNTINSDAIKAIQNNLKTYADNDILLSNQIMSETSRASAAEANLNTEIENEAARATNAEAALDRRISELDDRVVENTNSIETVKENLSSEVERATEKENTLSGQISNLSASVTSLLDASNRHEADLNNIKTDKTIIRNNYDVSEPEKRVVLGIEFLNSEEEYEELVANNKIKDGILYLIKEEEE